MQKKFLMIFTPRRKCSWGILIFLFFIPAGSVSAGFGVSPPYIKSSIIRPGAHYEKTINLLRTSAEKDLFAEILVNGPEIVNWISFDKEKKFLLPAGELQVPLTVIIDAPETAEIGNYQGKISLKTSSASNNQGMIGISTGAEIDIDIDLTKDIFREFLVKDVRIPDYEIAKDFWGRISNFIFFQKLKVNFKIENIGNIKLSPTKVVVDVYDIGSDKLLVSTEDSCLKEIKPFKTEEISADLPLELKSGQYSSRIKVYSKEKVVYSNNIAFSVIDKKNNISNLIIIVSLFSILVSLIMFISVKKKKQI